MAHRLNHINPTVGPYMSHIIWFCKGMNVALGSTSANDYETTQGSLCVYKYKIFDNYYHIVSLEACVSTNIKYLITIIIM